jgi:hypothetical protein
MDLAQGPEASLNVGSNTGLDVVAFGRLEWVRGTGLFLGGQLTHASSTGSFAVAGLDVLNVDELWGRVFGGGNSIGFVGSDLGGAVLDGGWGRGRVTRGSGGVGILAGERAVHIHFILVTHQEFALATYVVREFFAALGVANMGAIPLGVYAVRDLAKA